MDQGELVAAIGFSGAHPRAPAVVSSQVHSALRGYQVETTTGYDPFGGVNRPIEMALDLDGPATPPQAIQSAFRGPRGGAFAGCLADRLEDSSLADSAARSRLSRTADDCVLAETGRRVSADELADWESQTGEWLASAPPPTCKGPESPRRPYDDQPGNGGAGFLSRLGGCFGSRVPDSAFP